MSLGQRERQERQLTWWSRECCLMKKETRTPVATGGYIASDAIPGGKPNCSILGLVRVGTRWQTPKYGFGRYPEHTRGEPESRANVARGAWTRDQVLLDASIGGLPSRNLKKGREKERTPLHPWPLKKLGDNWLKFKVRKYLILLDLVQ